MKHKPFAAGLIACFALGVALLLMPPRSAPAPSATPASRSALPKPPSRVVMILIDALRADRLPSYGNPKPLAPYLDGLARRSVLFEHAHAASSWTSSSVASLFTGLYPHEHQVWTGFAMSKRSLGSAAPLRLNRLPDGAKTLAERMKQWGYGTFGASNNPNFAEEMGFRRGFDRFAHFSRKTGDVIQKAALEMAPAIRKVPRSFLYLHFMDTHKPYYARDAWLDPTEPDHTLARYDSELGYVDHVIAQLAQALDFEHGTLVIVLADHGEEHGEHGGQGHSNQLYAELLRVPLFFYCEGLAPRRVADLVSLVDILPTLEAWLGGGKTRTNVAGESLVPLLEGRSLPERSVFAMRRTETEEPPKLREAVMHGRYKYIRSLPEAREELYDMHDDPGEHHDLSASGASTLSELRAELDAYKRAVTPLPRAFAESEKSAAELSEQLRSLGYVQ